MKKLFLTLVVSLALCGSVVAQSHWPNFDPYHNPYEMQGALVAAVIIDGQPIDVSYEGWDALEISAWVGDDCRANNIYLNDEFVIEFGDPYPVTWGDAVFYTTPGETLTFKMYDHTRYVEYVFVTALQYGAPLTLVTGDDHFEGWDNPDDVISLSFNSPETIIWNNGSDWPSGDIPPAGGDVSVPDHTIVIVPDGYIAEAGAINMGEGSTIFIEEGGQLYHNNEIEVCMQLDVTGYTAKNNAGYRLFACPVADASGSSTKLIQGTNLNAGTFDLYKFAESEDLEWRNYKGDNYATDNTDVNFTELVRGEGYLYANNATHTFVLSGYTVPTVQNYEVTIPLTFTSGAYCEGLNLVGNPYTRNAYVMDGAGYRSYYELTSNGDAFDAEPVAAGTPIAPMKGLFVVATATDQSCTFTTAAPNAKGSLNITVNQGRGKLDNAILSFGEGGDLVKFQFNPNHTKVYIPQNGKDYAVVSAGEMGETPVNFKAESNGSYTLSFSSEEVSFNYLHLIDNLTGADVDLLATPYYTFDAKTTDYASRFKLVYATGNNTEDNFAFYSNGSFVISNEGEATLQVVDVMGRIVKSESINGSASVSVNAAAGVYMLRLVNGSDMKVQKIVVK